MVIRYLINDSVKSIENSNEDIEIKRECTDTRCVVKITAKTDLVLLDASKTFPLTLSDKDLYFLNGYQSWTDTKEFKLSDKLKDIKKCPQFVVKPFGLDKYGDSTFYDYAKNKSHGYDIFYSKGENESFIFNLNYKTAYLIIELIKDKKEVNLISDINGKAVKSGEEVTVFDYGYYDKYADGLAAFYKEFKFIEKTEKVFGYTSWYNYYQDITEDIIMRDLDALDSRFNVFQIDDGYETFVGDWLDIDAKKFPNGLKPIVDKIHEKGYKAGIWLAPFSAETKSRLFNEHPDWIKKDKEGNPVLAGGNWSKFYALDLENPEVIAYIKKFLGFYMDLGFDFFKLDFLYSSSIIPFKGKTRCETQEAAYQLLRDILKGKLILGCGANIINSYKKFDYLRVGPDVSLIFDDIWVMRFLHRERISTKVTLQNTIYRSIFNKHLFFNDPDVFLLRDDNIKLSKDQRRALTKLNALFGGVLMTSDNIKEYDDEKKAILDEALNIFNKGNVVGYKTCGQLIEIEYEVDGKKATIKYDTQKGILV
ncbi:MAG: alpha-galactosidase [Bacilli bacterium]|nr:alpha-galactosidase [Bacilli bacterium]